MKFLSEFSITLPVIIMTLSNQENLVTSARNTVEKYEATYTAVFKN